MPAIKLGDKTEIDDDINVAAVNHNKHAAQ